ncbi:Minor extracellular protease vpr [Paramyrothecium foliicola]|nr:Minor extracellular protease vpr [Paramyrothecium foliicola]
MGSVPLLLCPAAARDLESMDYASDCESVITDQFDGAGTHDGAHATVPLHQFGAMINPTAALSLLVTACAAFTLPEPDKSGLKFVPGAYIVEFDEGANANQFRVQAAPEYETRMEFDFQLFKGVSIQLNSSDSVEQRAAELASLPAVKNIWPVRVFDRPAPVKGFPIANSTNGSVVPGGLLHERQANGTSPGNAPHVMTQVDRLHAKGITGKGITIAIIDTGVDYHHPALGGCFGEGCRVALGYDLVGDDYDGYTNIFPDDDPDDTCDGHGTHVAGIIAASGDLPYGFSGAAPDATIAAYRVFGCQGGGVTNEVLIAAFNRAYEDGADIITASIGGRNGWSAEPWSAAVSRIVEKGVPCTLAAGNSGGNTFLAEAAGDGKGVTAIASFENTNYPVDLDEAFYTIDDGSRTSFLWNYWFPDQFDGTEREVWVTGYDLNNNRDACDPLPADTPDLSEHYVLIRRSNECSPAAQAANVAAKGARYFISYNNERPLDEKWSLNIYEGNENIEGAAAVLQKTGESWVKALEAGSIVKAEFTHFEEARNVLVIEDRIDGGAVSAFSSWGPTWEMDFKPQFGAPGGDILSTFPLELGEYLVASGTSMATPFAAAAYALLAEARGLKPEPQLFERLFSSTAKPQFVFNMDKFDDYMAPAVQQGAGLIQVYDAAYTKSYLEPSSLSFNDTANFAGTLNFTIINEADTEVTYEVSHTPAHSWYTLQKDAINPPWPWDREDSSEHAELAFSTSNVIVSPGASANVAVTVTPPSGIDERRYPVWTGFISVKGSDGSTLSLPYQGLSGSLYDATMIDEDGKTLVTSIDNQGQPLAPNTTFTLPPQGVEWDGVDIVPLFYFQNIWGTPRITLDVLPAGSCSKNSTVDAIKPIGQIFNATYVPPIGLIGIWAGNLNNGEYVPAGRYKLVLKILRIFGDLNKEEDYVVVKSTPFAIRYREE